MSSDDRARWNLRHADRPVDFSPADSLVALAERPRPIRPGARALDLACGSGRNALFLAQLGYDVLSVDWRIPIDVARARAPGVAIQGNLDSTVLLGPREAAVEKARRILRAAGTAPGYIFNLGHGIQPGTPPENVKAVVDAVHAWK